MSVEKALSLAIEINDLLDIVKSSLDMSFGRKGDASDIRYVKKSMGVNEIFELELVLLKTLGSMHLSYPLLSFDHVLEKDSPIYFRRVLDSYPEWLKLGWIPFCTDGCGNYFVSKLSDSFEESRPVFEIITGQSTVRPNRIVASNILFFLRRLLRGEIDDDDNRFDDAILLDEDPDLFGVRAQFAGSHSRISTAH